MHQVEIPLSSIEKIVYDSDGYGNIGHMVIEVNGEYRYTTDLVVTKAVVDRDYIKKSDLVAAFRKREHDLKVSAGNHAAKQRYASATLASNKAEEVGVIADTLEHLGRLPNDF